MSLLSDLRLARLITRGTDRLERRRAVLTGLGAAVAAGLGCCALALTAIRGQVWFPYGHGLLDDPGTRHGVIAALLLLLVPILGFLGQCARVGAVHRDRRLAMLRLGGAGPRQTRRIAALETARACLLGALVAAAGFAVALALLDDPLRVGPRAKAVVWLVPVAVTVAVPLLGVLASRLALRKVVASPLGTVRRQRPRRGPGLLTGIVLPVAAILIGAGAATLGRQRISTVSLPLFVVAGVVLTGAAAIWLAGATAGLVGRRLGARTDRPDVLLAAHRLQSDPWAASRSHATVILVTVIGVTFAGFAGVFLDLLHASQDDGTLGMSFGYYTFGLWLTGAAVAFGLLIALAGLAVGTAESLSTRRRALAAQAAAGVPRRVLTRALLLETGLPLAPALLLATVGGTALHTVYACLVDGPVSWALPLLVPVVVLGACLLAATTALPLLGRTLRTEQLRTA